MKKQIIATTIILLFIGVAVAPSINVVVAKETIRNKFVDSVVGSSRVSKNNLVTMVNAYKKDGPGIWLLFIILEILSSILKTINYVVNLIKEGKLVSETFRGVCFILLVILLIPAAIRVNIQWILGDLLPRDWEDTILYKICVWLDNIVFPDNPYAITNFHLFVKNKISTGIPVEDG